MRFRSLAALHYGLELSGLEVWGVGAESTTVGMAYCRYGCASICKAFGFISAACST